MVAGRECMKKILIRSGRVVDPSQNIDKETDVLIVGDRIEAVDHIKPSAEMEVIDAAGMVVTPGWIDMHVHLREPGREEEETIASGAAAAVAGGFTSIVAMPNTDPPIDNQALAEFVRLQGRRAGLAHVYPVGTITKGRGGEELAELGALARGGAVAFSDDGPAQVRTGVMRLAMEYAKIFDKPIIEHCEDIDLTAGGVMHEGYYSTTLGLRGIPGASEEIAVARDIALCALTGGRLHVAHVSAARSVELIRDARRRGLSVTAEVSPHHLALTDADLKDYDTNLKVNPPLRSAEDREALRKALAEGVIEVIATDHAPHTLEEKDVEFDEAAFGMVGLETALPLIVTELLEPGILTYTQAIRCVTESPARILGIGKGTLRKGAEADVTIFDPKAEWTIDVTQFRSKARNSPFHNRLVRGTVVRTIVLGETRFASSSTPTT